MEVSQAQGSISKSYKRFYPWIIHSVCVTNFPIIDPVDDLLKLKVLGLIESMSLSNNSSDKDVQPQPPVQQAHEPVRDPTQSSNVEHTTQVVDIQRELN